MLRASLGAALVVPLSCLLIAQEPGTLRVSIVLADANTALAPVARHALLISDNPATTPPRRVVTGSDGTVSVRLRPGNYTVESEQPVAFGDKSYEWTATLDVPPDGALLVLNAGNADIGDASSGPGTPAARSFDPSMTLQQWKPSVVSLWTQTIRASGFLIDGRGLIATNQRVVRGVSTAEVQLSPGLKVQGRVIASDSTRNVALLWVDAAAVAGVHVLAPPCTELPPQPAEGDELFALGVPLRLRQDSLSSGAVRGSGQQRTEADLRLAAGAEGGPVFSESAGLVGLSSPIDDADNRRRDFAVVPIGHICDLFSSAEAAMQATTAPSALRLPTEPLVPVRAAALKEAVSRRAGDLNPYQVASSDFEIAFITPVMTFAAQQPYEDRRTTSRDTNRPPQEELRVSRQMMFANWSEYVADVPPVLLVRVTPKMTEGFWRTMARGAAMTQGIQLPPTKQAKARLSRMRVLCGDAEVTPIHQLTIQTPITEAETFDEGLYAFAPEALGPACGTVRLALYSDKEPEKADSRTVDAAILARIEQDFSLSGDRAPR